MKGIAENETNIPNKEIWNKLINSLKHQGRKLVATFNGIRDVFCRKDNMTPELFIFFSEWLFEYASLEKRQETLRTIFPTSLIINDHCLKIMICHKEKITSILKAAGQEEASDFRDAILDILKYNTNVELLEFAKHIGAELPEENQENN